MFSTTGETFVPLKGVTAENMAEAARILSAWLDAPPQKRVWKEWTKNKIEVAYRTPGSTQQRSTINVINRENLIQAVDLLLKWAEAE